MNWTSLIAIVLLAVQTAKGKDTIASQNDAAPEDHADAAPEDLGQKRRGSGIMKKLIKYVKALDLRVENQQYRIGQFAEELGEVTDEFESSLDLREKDIRNKTEIMTKSANSSIAALQTELDDKIDDDDDKRKTRLMNKIDRNITAIDLDISDLIEYKNQADLNWYTTEIDNWRNRTQKAMKDLDGKFEKKLNRLEASERKKIFEGYESWFEKVIVKNERDYMTWWRNANNKMSEEQFENKAKTRFSKTGNEFLSKVESLNEALSQQKEVLEEKIREGDAKLKNALQEGVNNLSELSDLCQPLEEWQDLPCAKFQLSKKQALAVPVSYGCDRREEYHGFYCWRQQRAGSSEWCWGTDDDLYPKCTKDRHSECRRFNMVCF